MIKTYKEYIFATHFASWGFYDSRQFYILQCCCLPGESMGLMVHSWIGINFEQIMGLYGNLRGFKGLLFNGHSFCLFNGIELDCVMTSRDLCGFCFLF